MSMMVMPMIKQAQWKGDDDPAESAGSMETNVAIRKTRRRLCD